MRSGPGRAPATTSARAAWPSPSPRWPSPAASAPAIDLAGHRPTSTHRRCSPSRPAGFVVRGRARPTSTGSPPQLGRAASPSLGHGHRPAPTLVARRRRRQRVGARRASVAGRRTTATPMPASDAGGIVSRPRAVVLAGPGTNRDRDVAFALDLAGAEPHTRAARRAGRPTRSCSTTRRSLVVAGGFSYADALGAGRMLGPRAAPPASATRSRAFVAAGRPVIGICNGFQVLTRAGLLPGALGHNADGRFDCRWVDARRRAAQSRASGRDGHRRRSTARSPTARAATCTPTPTALAAAGQVALRYAGGNPNGSVADIAGVCDATGLVLGLMPHPENHVRRPPAPAASRRRRDPRATSGLRAVRAGRAPRQGALRCTSTCSEPFIDVDLAARPTGATARCGCRTPAGDGDRACSSPPTACRRSTGSSPACRTRARCSTSWPRGGSPQTADIVANHVVDVPDPERAASPAAATPLPVEVVVRGDITGVTSHVAVAAVRRRRSARSTATTCPTGCAKNTALPDGDRHARPPRPSDGAHDEPLTLRRGRRPGLVDADLWERGAARRARAVRPRPARSPPPPG